MIATMNSANRANYKKRASPRRGLFTNAAPCRHCEKHPCNRARGLCWRCYNDYKIRSQFDSVSAYGKRGSGLRLWRSHGYGVATEAMPGTPDKILVMQMRAEDGLELFSPDDLKYG